MSRTFHIVVAWRGKLEITANPRYEFANVPSEHCQASTDSWSAKRWLTRYPHAGWRHDSCGARGASSHKKAVRPIDWQNQSAREGSANAERLAGRLSAVHVSIGNFFLGNFRQSFDCEPISTLVSTMQPCRPHPACSGFGNSEACPCRNSGQIKVAAPRAAHLNLSPRCGDLAGEPSLSSHIDALVPAALRSGDWREYGRMAKGKIENSARFSMLNRLKLKTRAGY